MKIGLTQFRTVWEDVGASMDAAAELFSEAAAQGIDVLVFPEFTLTGFTLRPRTFCDTSARPRMVEFFRRKSAECGVAAVFGYIQEDGGQERPLNKLAVVRDGEVVLDYAKVHSYSFGREDRFYSRGASVSAAELFGMNASALICFDLRFPEIFQEAARRSDIIFVIANWPADRLENWYTLLRARALETQCYIAGANRAGTGGGVDYAPSSVAFGPDGARLTDGCAGGLVVFEAEKEVVDGVRASFPLRADRRDALYADWYGGGTA
ncbi:MAG: hypothetical protein K2H09_06795 [Treponemataceae bacterium]|nr:hypothetical protein [Treponemataceae bacterium]